MNVESVFNALGDIQPVGDSCGPMDLSAVNDLEVASGGRIPHTLRFILLTYGAFTFERDIYFPSHALISTSDHTKPPDLYVAAFLGGMANQCGETNTVLWNYELCRSSIGEEYIPFADSGGHGMFVVDASFQSNGRVMYWQTDGGGLHPLTTRFEDFLSALIAR